MWMVEGLDESRWALLSKVHHCMVDGVAATDVMSLMFDDRSRGGARGSWSLSSARQSDQEQNPGKAQYESGYTTEW